MRLLCDIYRSFFLLFCPRFGRIRPSPHLTRLTPMFTNRKRNGDPASVLLSALRRQVQLYASPYFLSEKEQRVDLTSDRIRRHRHALLRRRRPRAPRSAAAELTRLRNRRTFLDYLYLALFHPTSLLRRPRFLTRNKKRWHFRRNRQHQPG